MPQQRPLSLITQQPHIYPAGFTYPEYILGSVREGPSRRASGAAADVRCAPTVRPTVHTVTNCSSTDCSECALGRGLPVHQRGQRTIDPRQPVLGTVRARSRGRVWHRVLADFADPPLDAERTIIPYDRREPALARNLDDRAAVPVLIERIPACNPPKLVKKAPSADERSVALRCSAPHHARNLDPSSDVIVLYIELCGQRLPPLVERA